MQMESAAISANANQQMLASIASGVGAVAGTYSSTRTAAPVLNSGVSIARNGTAYNSSTGYAIPRAQIVG